MNRFWTAFTEGIGDALGGMTVYVPAYLLLNWLSEGAVYRALTSTDLNPAQILVTAMLGLWLFKR